MKKTDEIFEKRYLTRVAAYVLTAVVALGIMIFLGYHVVERFSPGLELVDAIPTKVTRTLSVEGYVMRDEEPLYAAGTTSGSVVSAVRNGGRVAVGSKIAEVYSAAGADIESRLAEIEEQISLLQKSKNEHHSVQSTTGVESEIYDTITEIRSCIESGDYAGALSLRSTLLIDIKKKAILTGEITDFDSQISTLQIEKSKLRSSLGACLETVHSDSSGYYFSEYDGYGLIFSPDAIDDMTFEQFNNMLLSDPYYGGKMCIGVMVHGYEWYIAVVTDRADADEFKQNESYPVQFIYSNKTLDMTVERIINDSRGEQSVVVFATEKMPADFDYTRMQPVRISVEDYEGFKLPLTALRVVGGYEGVYIKDEVTIKFRRINIIYEADGYVICTGEPTDDDDTYGWIKQNDTVVVGGTELYSGKVIS